MPQEFHVVRCFSCESFQSQQVKKVNKFVCKLCGSKQSVRKEYGRGSGKDCRIHVQKLNNLRGDIKEKEEDMIERRLQEESDLNIEHFEQEYNLSEQYNGGDEYFDDDNQYNDFQYESGFNEKLGSAASVGSSNMNEYTKESRKSKWTAFLSDETGDEEDELTEEHKYYNTEKEGENYEGHHHSFDYGLQKNRIAMNKTKRIRTDDNHPFQSPTATCKSSYNVNSAETDKILKRKYNESPTKVPGNSSTQRKTNFYQSHVTCPSSTKSVKDTKIHSVKENTNFKEKSMITVRNSMEAKMSTKKIGDCFTAENSSLSKEISYLSDRNILLENQPRSSLTKFTKPAFIAKVKGTQKVYNKFADAHELEDIL